MNQLEQTLINAASQHLSAIRFFLASSVRNEDSLCDFQADHGALCVLLSLAHQSDSGLGPEARAKLLEIDSAHAAILRTENEKLAVPTD